MNCILSAMVAMIKIMRKKVDKYFIFSQLLNYYYIVNYWKYQKNKQWRKFHCHTTRNISILSSCNLRYFKLRTGQNILCIPCSIILMYCFFAMTMFFKVNDTYIAYNGWFKTTLEYMERLIHPIAPQLF